MPRELRINEKITAPRVLLIDETAKSLGNVSTDQALWLAWERDLDLVEVGPNAAPPVTKLLDFGKFQYEQAKAENKSRVHAPGVKEIRLTLKIGERDLNIKAAQALKWFESGDKVRVTVTLHGREKMFVGRAKELIERVRLQLTANYEIEGGLLGNRISALLIKNK